MTYPPSPKFFGIAPKFIISIILFSSVLTLIGTCLQLYIDYRKDIHNIRQQLAYIETSHLNSLNNSIWLYDEHALKTQMDGILALPLIESVKIQRNDGPELIAGQANAGGRLTHTVPLTYRYRDKTVPLGVLHITAGTDKIIKRLKERAVIILATQFVQIFFVSAFIFFLFYQLVGRHLQVMAAHTSSLNVNNLSSPLILQRSPPSHGTSDELEQVVAAFNGMQGQISSYITEKQVIEEALHEKARLLEEEIAQRQQAQEELNFINESLEDRINTAITELRQKDELLIQQNRLAAMGELLNSIAHQWRQPLNNIAVYIQGMQFLRQNGELTDEQMDQDIEAVMQIIHYMSHTIDDFRGFFQKDRTKTDFSLRKQLDRSLQLISAGLTASSIRIRISSDEDLTICGFPNEYAQTLMNILHNARDILLERKIGNPEVTISIFRENGRSVTVIEDNGGGIAPDILPHIFEPYFTTKGVSGGTGIGLYMAKTIIEKHMGGTLTARNTAAGAAFRIEL